MNTAIADKHALIPANEWFGGGHRVPYYLHRHHIVTAHDDLSAPYLMVSERVVGAPDDEGRWMSFLPGYPDGSYGYAKVNALLGEDVVPRLYPEYIGQGDSDKPRDYGLLDHRAGRGMAPTVSMTRNTG